MKPAKAGPDLDKTPKHETSLQSPIPFDDLSDDPDTPEAWVAKWEALVALGYEELSKRKRDVT
jgi:hypothetical protein